MTKYTLKLVNLPTNTSRKTEFIHETQTNLPSKKMNTREFQSAVMIKIDACMHESRETRKLARAIDVKVNNILPQTHPQPFSKPSQKDVGRDMNIASWFRLKTEKENENLPAGNRKYFEFPEGVSDEQLNEDMKRCMHSIMCERLPPGWETKNWNVIYNSDKTLGEQIIKEAAMRPEMTVISQSAGLWAVRTVAEQRQKSTKRAAQQRNARHKSSQRSTVAHHHPPAGSDEIHPVQVHSTFQLRENTIHQNCNATQNEVDLSPGESSHNIENEQTTVRAEPPTISMAAEAVMEVKDLGADIVTEPSVEHHEVQESSEVHIAGGNSGPKNKSSTNFEKQEKSEMSNMASLEDIFKDLPRDRVAKFVAFLKSDSSINVEHGKEDGEEKELELPKKRKRSAANIPTRAQTGNNCKTTKRSSKSRKVGKKNRE